MGFGVWGLGFGVWFQGLWSSFGCRHWCLRGGGGGGHLVLELVEHEGGEGVVDVEAGGRAHVGDKVEGDLVGLGWRDWKGLRFLLLGV